MIGLAANSSAFVLSANKDLKAGRITPEEYMRKLHRVNSSADTTFELANNFNSLYEDKLKRMDDKTSGNVEQVAFEAMSKLVDFNKHDFMIDQNGTIVAAPLITDKDGITRLDANNARSVQAIFNLAQNTVDRFDVEGTVAESVKKLGKKVEGTSVAATYGNQGLDVLLEGFKLTAKGEYDKWKESQINRMTVNDLDTASILTDYSSDYETTTDEKEWAANKDKFIYVDIKNGKEILIGELTEDQKADARNILDGVIESQVGTSRKERATSKKEYPRANATDKKAGATKASKTRLSTVWNKIYYAKTTEEKNMLAQQIIADEYSINQGLVSIDFNKNGKSFDIKFLDSQLNTTIDIPEKPTIQDWAGFGSNIHGVSDQTEAMRLGGGKQDGLYIPATGVFVKRRGNAVGAAAEEIRSLRNTDLLYFEDDEAVISDFITKYAKYGFDFTTAGTSGNNIIVTAADKTKYTLHTNYYDEEDTPDAYNDFEQWMLSKLTREGSDRAYQVGANSGGSTDSGGSTNTVGGTSKWTKKAKTPKYISERE